LINGFDGRLGRSGHLADAEALINCAIDRSVEGNSADTGDILERAKSFNFASPLGVQIILINADSTAQLKIAGCFDDPLQIADSRKRGFGNKQDRIDTA
jgi:hypothetical protein